MRLLVVILLSISTSLSGWAGSLTAHIEEQCHVVEGEHHEESLSDHEEAHHATPGHEQHDAEDDCEPEHCSDHCNVCHTSAPGCVTASAESKALDDPLRKGVSIRDQDKLSSISLRPDTPPPKA